LARADVIERKDRVFLGEDYFTDASGFEGVRNSEGNVTKLQLAYDLFEKKLAGEGVLTCRQFASLIGLVLFMAHTIDLRINQYFNLWRAYTAIYTATVQWDEQVHLTSEPAIDQLREIIRILLRNDFVKLPVLTPPSTELTDYSAVAIVDASASQWGAYVYFPARDENDQSTIWKLQRQWDAALRHSAHAEPCGAYELLRWIHEQGRSERIAIITDHAALALGQRRWWSNYNGFGRSFYINRFYQELYRLSPGAEIFQVPGEKNIADGPSRDPYATRTLSAQLETKLTFPSLTTFTHPFATHALEEWQV